MGRKLRTVAAAACIVAFAMTMLLAGCAGTKQAVQPTTVNVSSLKGPTSIGLVKFMDDAKSGTASVENQYNFTVAGTADEILPSIVQGSCDIALIPANAAATLSAKTNGGITVIDINTLGVLSVVSGDSSISSLSDLAGRTVYMTGKGTTPEYVMEYLLAANGLTGSVNLEYESEATQVAAVLAADPSAVGVLPEPYATSINVQDPSISSRISLTAAWNAAQQAAGSGSQLVTGVTVVRTAFLQEHPEAVQEFLDKQASSVSYANANPAETAKLVVDQGIIANATIAQKAIPACNLVCLTGSDMKAALSGYLQVLYGSDPSSVGGALPGDSFYTDVSPEN